MNHFIDRRENPKGKSLGNRQRLLRRTRQHLKEVVSQAVRKRSVKDLSTGETVSVPKKRIDEPQFILSRGSGRRERVFPGNKDFIPGDRIRRPDDGAGQGRQGAPDGDGEDDFTFALTREEFLEILFEGLELPDLVKTALSDVKTQRPRRAGFTTSGTQSNLSVQRTMRNAFGRRLALRRPSLGRLDRLRDEIEALQDAEDEQDVERLNRLRAELERLENRRKAIAFVDPLDVRYRRFTPEDVPNTKAVMFCLMDVSASMGEREKELAKRFFLLLHLFIERCYEASEIVFIRHTHFAQEVDEDTFFHGRETGGTKVSTALEEMDRVIAARYPTNDWNIYVAQASDGENLSGDSRHCVELLDEKIMQLCQYFAYIEIVDVGSESFMDFPDAGGELWQSYSGVQEEWPNFQMKRVSDARDIYPVFRELFAKRELA